MSMELVLWATAGLVSSAFLLMMMRRRQLYLIGLLTEYVQRQSEWNRRKERAKELAADFEKRKSALKQAANRTE